MGGKLWGGWMEGQMSRDRYGVDGWKGRWAESYGMDGWVGQMSRDRYGVDGWKGR